MVVGRGIRALTGDPKSRRCGRVVGVCGADIVWRIRPLAADELTEVRDLERASGEPFRSIGMGEIADEEPLSLSDLRHYLAAGRAWVITEAGPADRMLGFLLAEPVDTRLHIAQVSVHPSASRRGLGRRLIEHLAGSAGIRGLSLTTYADVPWNGPYYRTLGFGQLPDEELGPGLTAIREAERRAGLDRWPRIAMIRPND
jgi:GNAT superfamily N-acetyltransferase